jgi:DNA-binding IclR family transcriptional regulator
MDLRTQIRPFFRSLSARLGETAHFGVLQKTCMVYLAKAGRVLRLKDRQFQPGVLHSDGQSDARLATACRGR